MHSCIGRSASTSRWLRINTFIAAPGIYHGLSLPCGDTMRCLKQSSQPGESMKHFSLLRRQYVVWILQAVLLGFAFVPTTAQQIDPKLFESLRWRNIGPLRAGRVRAISGVPSQQNVFYMAQVNGGVWKTADYGRTWTPIFDDQPTGSVGSIAVALSDPNIVYVGSGEGLQRPDLSVGDGIYKSTDAGKTWTHLGLRDGQQIPQIAVDPRDANRILVAVAGHPYGPNEERGIFRSTDGGKTFEKVLYKDENIGGADVLIDP